MSPFKKNLQRFFIFFFTAISTIIIIVGFDRAKKASLVTEVPTSEPTPTPTAQTAGSANITTPPTTNTKNGNVTISQNNALILSFTGKTYQTPYGNVSAAIQVKNGKIINVTMPKVPDSPPSIYAESILIDQALKAGSANIQGVSGATYTSIGFKSSLESAIAQASTHGQTVAGSSPAANVTTNTATKAPSVPRRYRDDDDE